MIRIIGILCGSALAISLLIMVLGIPEILPAKPAPVESEELALEPPALAEPEPVTVLPEPVNNDVDLIEEPHLDESVADADIEALPESLAEPPPQAEDNWYAFWSPFRSELAANGFVSQLQRTTGLDYRVVKIKTGVYEVAFAYADDADIETKLAAIASATGLDLPGG